MMPDFSACHFTYQKTLSHTFESTTVKRYSECPSRLFIVSKINLPTNNCGTGTAFRVGGFKCLNYVGTHLHKNDVVSVYKDID